MEMMSNENGKRPRVVRRRVVTVTQDFDVYNDRYVDISPSLKMDENDCGVVDELVKIQEIWETPGEERYANMRTMVRQISDVDHRVCSLRLSCYIYHYLPDSILQLDALEVLDLSRCKFLKEIPPGIKQLQNLTTLDLPCDRDFKLRALPNEIWDLTKLRALRCEGEGWKLKVSIPPSIGNMNQLEELILPKVTIVPEEIGNLQQLRVLRFLESQMIKLPNSLGSLQNLEVLGIEFGFNFQFLNREPSFRDYLPGSIGSLKKLKKLSLQYLPHSKNEFLPSPFDELENLEELSIRVKDASLPHSLGKHKNLRKLDVGYGLTSIPDSIFTLTNLESLDMHVKMVELPYSFGGLKNLRSLDLGAKGLTSIPNSIFNLINLESLTLYGSTEITRLPDDIGRLVNLKSFNFCCSFIERLPDGIGKLKNLVELDLQYAQKLNPCTNAIRGLRNLKKLFITTNRSPALSDKNDIVEFGKQLASLKNIQELDVSGFIRDEDSLLKLASQLPFLTILSYDSYHHPDDDADGKLSSALSINRARTRIFRSSSSGYNEAIHPPISLWPLIFANIRSATAPFKGSVYEEFEEFEEFDSEVTFRLLVDYSPSFLSGNH